MASEREWATGYYMPAEHLGVARRFRSKAVEGQRLFDLAERLCARFDQAFP